MHKLKLYITMMLVSLSECLYKNQNSEIAKVLHRPMRALSFPEASTMGIFMALAYTLPDPDKAISFSYFFEATYNLPPNITIPDSFEEQERRKKRGINRTTIYQSVEKKFESSGYPGRECLLRSICETSEFDLDENGILGDIVKVIFTPSTSQPEDLPQDVVEAELVGRAGHIGTCSKYHSSCPVGLFDLIGILV